MVKTLLMQPICARKKAVALMVGATKISHNHGRTLQFNFKLFI